MKNKFRDLLQKFKSRKIVLFIVLVIPLIFFAVFLVVFNYAYSLGYRQSTSDDIQLNSKQAQQLNFTDDTRKLVNEKLYPIVYASKHGEYFFTVTPSESDNNKCEYAITSLNGGRFDLSNIDSEETICDWSMGNAITPEFKGWINNNEFILEREAGLLEKINIQHFNKSNFEYDTANLKYIFSNNQFNRHLFRLQNENNTYIVADENLEILKEILFKSEYPQEYIDAINNGVLFIDIYAFEMEGPLELAECNNEEKERCLCESDVCASTQVYFRYLSFDDLALQTLLETSPVTNNSGRGCYPTYTVPVEGMIHVNPQCLFGAIKLDKYTDERGYINLKL